MKEKRQLTFLATIEEKETVIFRLEKELRGVLEGTRELCSIARIGGDTTCEGCSQITSCKIRKRLVELQPNTPAHSKESDCKWHFDRNCFTRSWEDDTRTIWKTECDREFDRLEGSEQPRKHLCLEFCPFCGGHIIDMTTDC